MPIDEIMKKINNESFFLNASFDDMAKEIIKPEFASSSDPIILSQLQNEYAVFSVETTVNISKQDFCSNLGLTILDFSEQRINGIIEYIKHRCEETTSEIVKARYNHAIWLCLRKNDKYPKSAIDLYTSFAQRTEISDLNKVDFLSSAFRIAFSIKDDIEPIMIMILNTIFLSESTDTIFSGLKVIHTFRKQFRNVLRLDVLAHCYDVIKKQVDSGVNCFFLIETIDQITGLSQNLDPEIQFKWFELKGEIYELMAEDKDELIQFEFLGLAIHSYKKAKNKERENNCKLKYDKIWESFGGDNFPRKKMGEPFNHLMNQALKLNKQRCEAILRSLSRMPIDAIVFTLLSPAVIPNATSIRSAVNKRGKPIYMHFSSVSVFDEKGNLPEPINTAEQEFKYLFFQEYGLHMLTVKTSLQQLLRPLIVQNRLEIKTFIQMLTTKSLLGRITRNRKKTWMDAITPALSYYFFKVNDILIAHATEHIDFSLCIDSLVLKLEGILRDIFSINGVSPKKVGEKKTEECDLNYLLDHELMLRLYDENHVVFLKYILIEQLGLNLRNIVAHALKTNDEVYNESVMHCVFVCFLIIVFGSKSDNEEKSSS